MKKINAGYASSTVTHIKNAISGVLRLAVEDGVLLVNPAHDLGKLSQNKSAEKEVDFITKEELQTFLTTFKKFSPRYYPLVLTMARTGMRIGEAMALQWQDVDFERRNIRLRRNFSRGKLETPKNGKGRNIDMSKQLSRTLIELLHQRKIEKLKNGWQHLPEFIFVTEKGRPVLNTSHWRTKFFNKAVEKAKIRRITPHILRHTYASLLIQAGESLVYIKDQLGHHSIKVTVDIYGHLVPGGNKAAVDGLDDEISLHPTAPYAHPEQKKAPTKLAEALL
jgi:integrase